MDKFQSIEKLEGERNWASWKFDVDLQLSMHKVMSAVTGELKMPKPLAAGANEESQAKYERNKKLFDEADAVAKCIIGSSVRAEAKQHILTCKSSKDMWDTLHNVYEQKNERRLDLLYTQLFSYHKDITDDIATHVSKLQRIWQDLQEELKPEKIKLPNSMLLNRILNTLPNEYLEFKNAWESVPFEERTIASLTERLRLHEQRLKDMKNEKCETSNVALLAKTQSHKIEKKLTNAKTEMKTKGFIPKCYYCGKPGHFKKECRKLKSENTKSEDKQNKMVGQAFMTVSNNETENYWIIDSGASHHIALHMDWFTSYSAFASPKSLRLGDGRLMFAHGEGEIQIEMLVNNKWEPGYLRNVWYVPDGVQNLFSSGAALDNGLTEHADKEYREFKNKQGIVVAVGVRQPSGIYKLLLRVIKPEKACLTAVSSDLQIWHERLGHQNKRHIQKFLKQKGIEVKLDNELCDACMYGKMHRLSFGKRTGRPTQPGELINADVCGPMPTMSLGGKRYFLDFKDDFSKYRKVYFLSEKSEVKEKLIHFLAEVKTAGHSVKEILTDGGKEFDNKDVNKITQEAGLHHRMTMPYTPEQNGAAEQDNRTLVEAARTMLHAKDFPEKLWAEAINTAVYIINRTGPTPIEGKTPYELWYDQAASIDHLKIFGTECYIHIPQQKRKKFDKKAKKGYIVGYCGDKDGYRVWVPNDDDVIRTRDVIFKKEVTSRTMCSFQSLLEPIDIENNEPQEEGEEDQNIEDKTTEDKTHSEESRILRDRYQIKKPSKYDDFAMFVQEEEPLNFEDAIHSENSSKWQDAMNEEMKSLHENQTWKLVDKPEDRKVIDNRWVYKIKRNQDGSIDRFKARLVVKGYSQKAGVDFHETFSPVVRWDTIRALLSLTANEKLQAVQFDVKTAFLHGDLEEEVFMTQPTGYEDGTPRVCKLIKSLYGLKQAPRCWNRKFTNFLKNCQLKESNADSCLYLNKDKRLFVVLYVDDGIVVAKNEEDLKNLLSMLQKEFQVKIEPAHYFLGMEIHHLEDGSIFINQEAYANKVLRKFRMSDANPVSIPIDKNQTVESTDPLTANIPYREAIGSLMYLAIVTRPDLSFALSILSQVLDQPQIQHWALVKRVLKYIKGTVTWGILYKSGEKTNVLESYSDADYAGDVQSRRSTSGIVFKYSNGAIAWSSKRQRSVALSTTEAEFVSASLAAKDAIWLKRLFSEISDISVPILQIDNESAIRLIKNPEFHSRSKHIDVRYKFVREKYESGELKIDHVSSEDQIADMFTKALPKKRFQFLREKIGMCEL